MDGACHTGVLEEAAATCIGCGLCVPVQGENGCDGGEFGGFAARVLEAARAGALPDELAVPAFSCALCGACTVDCPAGISAAEVMRAARTLHMQSAPAGAQVYRPLQTDLRDTSFTRLRDELGARFDDLLCAKADVRARSLFFPGCTLESYAPRLCQVTFDALRCRGLADAMTTLCCGNTLRGFGLADRFDAYARSLADAFAAHGVQRVVAACPNCFYTLSRLQGRGVLPASLELLALPQVLADAGLRVPVPNDLCPDARTFAVHDSCPDRVDLRFGGAVRELLADASLVELAHAGRDAICCGSGGSVSMYWPEKAAQRFGRRVAEFDDSGADVLVTGCMSCCNSIRRGGGHGRFFLYLELLFGTPADWDAYERAIERVYGKMETGEAPPWRDDPVFPAQGERA